MIYYILNLYFSSFFIVEDPLLSFFIDQDRFLNFFFDKANENLDSDIPDKETLSYFFIVSSTRKATKIAHDSFYFFLKKKRLKNNCIFSRFMDLSWIQYDENCQFF